VSLLRRLILPSHAGQTPRSDKSEVCLRGLSCILIDNPNSPRTTHTMGFSLRRQRAQQAAPLQRFCSREFIRPAAHRWVRSLFGLSISLFVYRSKNGSKPRRWPSLLPDRGLVGQASLPVPRQSRIGQASLLICPVLLLLCIALHTLPTGSALAHGRAEAALYLTRTPTPNEVNRRTTRAKYEPETGCYLGAFIDFDSTLKQPIRDQNRHIHQDPAGFESIVQKPHAMYFFYLGYGRALPLDWVRFLAQRNKFVHIALEPNQGLVKVKDNVYLRRLADDMGRSGAKIFLRFASEMNGPWTKYHGDPKLYREKFRLVYQVMKKRAPNVALVWCPYMSPTSCISDYYPGDDATDWVGVNLYNVTYHNNSADDPSEHEHPADLLAYVYKRYAARKPIMICEYAATHYSQVEGKPRPDFAARKILTLYAALPRLYPRVKCINYFDSNNVAFASHRPHNDYSVTNDPFVTAAYRYAISSPHYLSAPQTVPPPPIPMPLRDGETLRGKVRLSCWGRAPSDILTVRYRVDGFIIYTAHRPDLWECIWDAGSVRPGKHKITLEVLRSGGKVAATQTLTVVTAPESSPNQTAQR
jgi:hypothetical protein